MEAVSRVATRFLNLLADNERWFHSVKECANALHVSPDHLGKCVKEVTGMPAKHHIDVALLRAAHRLHDEGQQLKEIAFQLGFNDADSFYKFWSRHKSM